MADGALPFKDGEPLPAGTILYRTVPDEPSRWVREDRRPTGYSFRPSTTQEHISMALGLAYPAEEILRDFPALGLVELDAATLLSRGLRVIYSPTLGRGHVSVYGLRGARKSLVNEIVSEALRVWEPTTHKIVKSLRVVD